MTILTATEPLKAAAAQALLEALVIRFGRYDQQIDQVMKEGYKSVEQSASQYGITVDLQHEIDEFRPTGHTEGLAVKLLRCW